MPDGFETAREITSLRKAGDLAGAVALYEDAIRRLPGDLHVLRAYAWCLYEADIKMPQRNDQAPPAPDTPDQLARVEIATRWVAEQDLSPGTAYQMYDPTPFVVLRGCSRLIRAERFDSADQLLTLLDPERLATTSDNSDYDAHCTEWFRLRTKCLSESQRWEELAALADEPRRAEVSGKNAHWVEYRFAMAFRALGRPQDALDGIERALRGKPDAWIKVLRAELKAELGSSDEAIELLRSALATANGLGGLKFLVNGLRQLAGLLQTTDAPRAELHLRILVLILQREGWPLRAADHELAASLGVELEAADEQEFGEIRKWWRAVEDSRRLEGRITKVLPGEGSGFLVADDGQEYYFSVPRKGNLRAPPVGTRVSFVLTDGFDKKRKMATKQASHLKVVGQR